MKTIYTYKNLPHSFLMSAVLCLFGVFFSSQAYSQHEDLLDRTWYLDKLVIEEDTIYTPTRGDDELDLASTIYFNSENDGVIDFSGCPGEYHFISMEFDETDNFFITSGIGGFAFQFCSDFWHYFEGLKEFTNLYFYDFFYGYGTEGAIPIYYAIYEDASASTLVLTNPDGYEAHYNSVFLSTPKFEELGFSIYPNPAQGQLNIRFVELPNNTSLEIYDVQGKLLENLMISELETQLNVSEYASGIYFIKMTDELGSTQVKKFIKQ